VIKAILSFSLISLCIFSVEVDPQSA